MSRVVTYIKPIINGLYGSRVPIINNNVKLEDQQWGTEHAPNFDVNAANKITVIKGASGLQYGGDTIGGLVIIEPVIVKKGDVIKCNKNVEHWHTSTKESLVTYLAIYDGSQPTIWTEKLSQEYYDSIAQKLKIEKK